MYIYLYLCISIYHRAPTNLQAALQREVDLLHDRHTYAQEGSDIRDNKFKVAH